MNWLFWLLLILGILLLVAPLFEIIGSLFAIVFWLLGGLLLIGAAIWAVVVLARSTQVAQENP